MARRNEKPKKAPIELVLPGDEESVSTRDIAKAARERIIQLATEKGGHITADMLLDDAKDEDSPLHAYFEWDDSEAANKYRIAQARTLIRSVQVVITTDTKRVVSPYFVRDPAVGAKEQGMVSIYALRTKEDEARDTIIREFKMAGAALHRARTVADVLQMAEVIDDFIDRIEHWRTTVMQPARADA